MFGIRLMFLLAVMGGLIAFIADKLGSKIGKKKLSVFGLRPHDTSVLLTVLSGVLIPEGRCLAGFSGGADSTALMYLLAEAMPRLTKKHAAFIKKDPRTESFYGPAVQ